MKNNGSLQIILGSILFGFIPFFVRFAPGLNISSIVFGRACFAALFAFIFILLTKKKKQLASNTKKNSFFHLINWTLFLTLAIVFYFLSIKKGSVAIAGTLMGMHPIFVVLFSVLLFKEKIIRTTFLACLIAIIGGVFVAYQTKCFSSSTVEGSLYSLLSAFFLGLNFTYHLKYLSHFSSIRLVFYQNILQLPILLPFVFLYPSKLNADGWISIAFLGIVCTGFAYFLVYNGSKYVQKQSIGILQMIENVIPIVLGIYLYNEEITLLQIIGIVLILLSSVLITIKKAD
jgi:drug/metabolite transporter (DMT)-like permease